jgi:diacylglycerol kinase family enzyme
VTEAADGLLRAESDLPLGIIPGGTANVLAGVLGVPAKASDALTLARSGRTRRFDVGYLPELDRYFLIGLGVGVPGQTVENADRDAKDRFGFMAYLGAFLEGLVENRAVVLDIEIDGKSIVAQGQSAIIANLGEMEVLGVALAQGVSPHDGKLHLFVIDHTEPGAVLESLRQLLGGERKKEVSGFLHRRGRSIRISTSAALSVMIDGEWIGRTPVEVTVAPRRVRLVVGKDYPEGEEDVLQSEDASGGAAADS